VIYSLGFYWFLTSTDNKVAIFQLEFPISKYALVHGFPMKVKAKPSTDDIQLECWTSTILVLAKILSSTKKIPSVPAAILRIS